MSSAAEVLGGAATHLVAEMSAYGPKLTSATRAGARLPHARTHHK